MRPGNARPEAGARAPGPGRPHLRVPAWRMVLVVLAVVQLFCAWKSAAGDVIRLRNGNSLEGRVEELPDGDIRLTIDEGRVVVLKPDEVMSREVREAPVDEVARRLKALDSRDHRGLVELAAWAELKGLRTSALRVYRRLLRLDPHHEGARSRLGYVLHHNRWVRRQELKGRGLRQFRGVWRTAEEIERIRRADAERDFRRQLGDLLHPNRFIREQAMLQLLENRDARLIPLLRTLLTADDPVHRMLAARLLAYHGFAVAAQPIYEALRVEVRSEVVTALIAALGSLGRGEIGAWTARDLSTPRATNRTVRNLLSLIEAHPHKGAVPAIIDLLSDPTWARASQRLLVALLGVERHSPEAWRELWRVEGPRLSEDLGTGWIGRQPR